MCEDCSVNTENTKAEKGRLMLWDFVDNAHCAVVGTCLRHEDLVAIARRLRLNIPKGMKDYDVHGYFVKATASDTREARAIHKLLDDRFRGALRKFARAKTDDEQIELWSQMRDAGQVAAAFYALMTSRDVSLKVRSQIFGEVHMLSHLMGGSRRDQSREVAALKAQLSSEQQARRRIERSTKTSLDERDRRIAALEKDIVQLRAPQVNTSQHQTAVRKRASSSKMERALATARERARLAEQSCETLTARLATMRERVAQRDVRSASGDDPKQAEMAPSVAGTRILYVGGMDQHVQRIRGYAEEVGIDLVYHDGGIEHSVARIDQVLPSVDCVLCPINCVSHDACQRAKTGCKKHGKPFLPLRSAGRKTFERAVNDMMRNASA